MHKDEHNLPIYLATQCQTYMSHVQLRCLSASLWSHSPSSLRGNHTPKLDAYCSLTFEFIKNFSVSQILVCLLWYFFG